MAKNFLRDTFLIIETYSGVKNLYIVGLGRLSGYTYLLVHGSATAKSKRRALLKQGALIEGMVYIKNRYHLSEFAVHEYFFTNLKSKQEVLILNKLMQLFGLVYKPGDTATFDRVINFFNHTFVTRTMSIRNGVYKILLLLNLAPYLKCSRCKKLNTSGFWLDREAFVCHLCSKTDGKNASPRLKNLNTLYYNFNSEKDVLKTLETLYNTIAL